MACSFLDRRSLVIHVLLVAAAGGAQLVLRAGGAPSDSKANV